MPDEVGAHHLRRILEISPANLPKDVVTMLDHVPNLRGDQIGDTSYLMFAPYEGPRDAVFEHMPDELVHVLTFARRHGCSYVLIDPDAPIVDALPSWDWC